MLTASIVKNLVLGCSIACAIPAAYLTYWWLDDTPPFERIFGQILPEDATKCGFDRREILDEIAPGSCVAVQWEIKIHRTDCEPINSLHVKRTITDVNGVHNLPRIENIYGLGKRAISNPLRRPFVLPEFSVPGAAVYYSEACFACNPLQWAGLKQPTCLFEPKIYYEVANPPIR